MRALFVSHDGAAYPTTVVCACPTAQAPYGLACSSTVWPCAFRHPSAAASTSVNTFSNSHATTITTIKECLGSLLTWSWAAVAAMRHGDGLKLEPRRRATGQPVVLLIPCEKHRKVKKSVAVGAKSEAITELV